MWLLILFFALVTLTFGWTAFAYFILVWFAGLFKQRPAPAHPKIFPTISMIVPCFNESAHIEAKIENMRALDYPSDRLEVFFVDGGSSDDTVDKIKRAGSKAGELALSVLQSPRCGKINQLNFALPQATGELIVNTDADALLEPDALRWLAAEFTESEEIAVVGAYCTPTADAYEIDRYYWDAQNQARLMESRAGCSSIVVAPCYAYRRGLLSQFPDDVVADDIYVAFLAQSLGARVVYSPHARAVEVRNPRGLAEFLPHKFRKSNAFLRESLRFVYRLPHMSSFTKMMLTTRIAQQLLFPWAAAAWLLIAASLVTLYPAPRYDIVVLATAFLAVLFLFTSYAFRNMELPTKQERPFGLATTAKGWILTTLILIGTGLTYAFYRQNSSYGRIGGGQTNAIANAAENEGTEANGSKATNPAAGRVSRPEDRA